MAETDIDQIRLEVDSDDETLDSNNLRVTTVHGVEAISTLYDFDLSIECQHPGGLPPEVLDELLDTQVTLRFGPGAARSVSGVISHIQLISWDLGDPDGKRAVYQAELVPRFWRTRMTHRSRCFVNESVPDIFETILDEYGLAKDKDFELRLADDYPDNADRHVVQFEESDFAFMSRWMERLGMYYFFEQTGDADVLIITDSKTEILEAEPYEIQHAHAHALDEPGRVGELSVRTQSRPRDVHVRDLNWGNASGRTSLVVGDATVQPGENPADPPEKRTGHGFQVHYGDHFLTDEEGAHVARRRAEGWMVRKRVYRGSGGNYHWAPGGRFTLSGTPGMPELDQEYLITAVTHHATAGTGGGGYSNTFEATEQALDYRPPRVTPWPRIEGVVNARIDDGKITSAAPIDNRGFYRVILPYDYHGSVDDKPSVWIRKTESYAGIDHGLHFTLHSGAEVLLAHVNGDPDRPVIVGTVPNASRPSPITKSENTRHILRTRSGIVFDFEDDAT